MINGYLPILGNDYMRGRVSEHSLATLESNKAISLMVTKLKQYPQITKAYAVIGTHDLIVVLEAK
ncbi:MAG: hypothetical protein OSA42_06665 [Porticoccaceae bacterium]|nr:hypothetical protein [Porticoccaceae bacterium]